MDENKSKSKGVSIAMILLAIVIGFGFVIGLTQTNAANNLKTETKSEISNYMFDEDGTLLSYSGNLTDLEIPATYSLSNAVEDVEMSSTSIYTLIEKARSLNLKEYKIENQTGYQTDDFGNQFYQEKYVMKYTKKRAIEGTDFVVKSISSEAFRNNSKITSVTLPDTIVQIGSNAFTGCTKLKTINLPEGLERIENAAFYNCLQLTDVVLPNSLSYIGPQAFQDCDKITNINIPTSMSTISNMTFGNCDGLLEIIIPSNITNIEPDAFYYCRNLKKVTLEEGVGYIGTNAFYNCRALTEIVMPSTVYYISNQAFWNCQNLRTITMTGYSVPNIDFNAFNTSYINKIYVPDEMYEDYLSDSNWSMYQDKITRISEKV